MRGSFFLLSATRLVKAKLRELQEKLG